MKIARALLSVYDKTGIVEFGRGLAAAGVELVSTGGTARALRDAGLTVTSLEQVTGFPEILGGRVKTLHPAVHGALLAARDNAEHQAELRRLGIRPIDLVAVTLYPFEAALARGAEAAALVEEIDIGGVTLLRAAAKNWDGVVVLSAAAQYADVLDELRRTGTIGAATRRRLAGEAFARTSTYDAVIAGWVGREADGVFPARLALGFEKIQDLRYGENPHQRGAFYGAPGAGGPSVAAARQLAGKELSYNNIFDLDAALELVREFRDPAAVVVKHAIPCGVGTGATLHEAYVRAHAGDPVSAFGGIVALNRSVDLATATALGEIFLEAVIAPAFAEDAAALLVRRKSLRLLEVGPLGEFGHDAARRDPGSAETGRALPEWDFRRVHGGLLLQDRDLLDLDEGTLRVLTRRAPSDPEWRALRFAWTVCRHVRSNAIVLAREGQVVGVGAGQTNRVEAVRIAVRVAGDRARGAVMASEAFFPFADGLEAARDAGVTAVIQPGGSTRDAEVVAAADAGGVAMVATGIRHFRH